MTRSEIIHFPELDAHINAQVLALEAALARKAAARRAEIERQIAERAAALEAETLARTEHIARTVMSLGEAQP